MTDKTETETAQLIEDLQHVLAIAFHDGLHYWKVGNEEERVYRRYLEHTIFSARASVLRPADDSIYVDRLKVIAKEVRAAVDMYYHPVNEYHEKKAILLKQMSQSIATAEEYLAREGEPNPTAPAP